MKFVHEECLQKWFKSKNAGESVRCILCEQTFCFKKIYGYDGEKCSRLLWKYLCTWAEWLGSVAVLVAIAAVEFILLPWFCWWRVKLEMQNVATSSLLPVQVKLFPSSSVEGWYYWFSGFTVLTFMVFVGRMLYITGRTYFLVN